MDRPINVTVENRPIKVTKIKWISLVPIKVTVKSAFFAVIGIGFYAYMQDKLSPP